MSTCIRQTPLIICDQAALLPLPQTLNCCAGQIYPTGNLSNSNTAQAKAAEPPAGPLACGA